MDNNTFDLKIMGDSPQYMTDGACGADVKTSETVKIAVGEVVLVPTNLRMQLPDNVACLILPRSGLSNDLQLANSVGLLDEDYRGTLSFKYRNVSHGVVEIKKGTRLGQVLFVPWLKANFIQVDSLDDTERGENGYGHTGED